MSADPSVRHLRSLEDYRACVELQRETWGDRFHDIVPASLLIVSQKIGGLLAGAFDPRGHMLGFVYSLYGVRGGRPIHWSHMLAVTERARGAGLGRRLKLFQRDEVLEAGIEAIYWTYDPLVARNGHLNLNRLGAKVDRFVPDMYGSDTGSPLHGSDETDRFVVRWDLSSRHAKRALDGGFSGAPAEAVAAPVSDAPPPASGSADRRPTVRVEVPGDFEGVLEDDPEEARRWRLRTRQLFQHYLEGGYEVEGLYREGESGRCFYWLNRKDA